MWLPGADRRHGLEALEVWEAITTSEIDLLFTDMVMPAGMSGVDLATNLINHCRAPADCFCQRLYRGRYQHGLFDPKQ